MAWIPDAVYLRIESAKLQKGDKSDPIIKRMNSFTKDKEPKSDPIMQHALGIYRDEFQKEIVESYLLINRETCEISELFDLSEEVLDAYSKVFFDTSTCKSELDKLSYVMNMDEDDFGKSFKEGALRSGIVWLNSEVSEYIQLRTKAKNEPTEHRSEELSKKAYHSAKASKNVRNQKAMTDIFVAMREGGGKKVEDEGKSGSIEEFVFKTTDNTTHIDELKKKEAG